ncbi:PAS domain-containing protein [Hahella sp. KA22]|uniref:chemotaxis protein CheB n=1 Tax=Hahella sp. KA22 TaxID=1628392 RepID=UPI000FDDD97F|nr:chemotaxis protein CheB [Hahella sp. KA22]AZZ94879.1 PAS domain-containing protein [Hahella sp. KA22]QAY58252.1 PAS domain-containing protein [Hahella sp. KA22]
MTFNRDVSAPTGVDTNSTPTFYAAAVGASAGGLEALKRLFSGMPARTGIVFIIITHQKAGHVSILPELLSNQTELPINVAQNGQSLKPDHIYINPSNGMLGVENGVFVITPFDEEKNVEKHHPVDYFFHSIAREYGDNAIGVILSGTGSDGTLGLRSIKEKGGLIIAEDPGVAEFAGMPASAIATGLTDYVLSPEDMPGVLEEYMTAIGKSLVSNKELTTQFPDEVMAQIFALLLARTGHDFSLYKTNTLYRRIERRMNRHRLHTAHGYVNYLKSEPQELDQLFKEFLIRVTSFFRDADVWSSLSKGALEELLIKRSEGGLFRVWVPGCSTGEEAYTVAFIITEILEKMEFPPRIQIFATDLDASAINIARKGVYDKDVQSEISHERLQKYFSLEGDCYKVNKPIRDMMVFAVHNIIKDPPFTKIDLISCRNLLIYMRSEMQRKLFSLMHYALLPEGLLVLGPSESIGDSSLLFEAVDKKHKIYRHKLSPDINYLPNMGLRLEPNSNITVDRLGIGQRYAQETPSFSSAVLRMLVNRFAPVCVIINYLGDICYIHGKAGAYLEPNEGRPRNNILEMARPGLRMELVSAMHQAAAEECPVVHRIANITQPPSSVKLSVERIQEPAALHGLLLVMLGPLNETIPVPGDIVSDKSDWGIPANRDIAESVEKDNEVVWLRKELGMMQLFYQNLVEQLETSNEELQSVNEELQSANEELETSKEEMQSLNEELSTVNNEFQSKLESLSQANDDMQNLLNSTDIATIFLDDNLCINRFTEQANKIVTLREGDVGRPISELALNNLDYRTLLVNGRQVLKTLEPIEIEFATSSGEWYSMRMAPYRTTGNAINGLVCTFLGISSLKQTETQLSYLTAAVNALPDPILALDANLTIRFANSAFYELFNLDRASVEHMSIYDVVQAFRDHAELKSALEQLKEASVPFNNLEVSLNSEDVVSTVLGLAGRRIHPESGDILITIRPNY